MNDSNHKNENLVDNQICLIRHTIPPKRFPKVTIIVYYEFEFFVILIIDIRSYMN